MESNACALVRLGRLSEQYAVALMDIEPRLRKVMGYRHLLELRDAIRNDLKINSRIGEKAV